MIELLNALKEIRDNLAINEKSRELTFQETMMYETANTAIYNFECNIPKIVGVGWETRDKSICHVLPKPNRHHNVRDAACSKDLIDFAGTDESRLLGESGFIVYLNRQQAYELAQYNGQLLRTTGDEGTLYSEDLW